ncbi:RNA polymerase sigma factor [Candidatus Nitrospira salsa]
MKEPNIEPEALQKLPNTEDLKHVEIPVLDDLLQRLMKQESAFRGFLRQRLSDDTLVEDLLQQSFIKAIERGHDLRNIENAVSWFYRILRNTVVDYYRSYASNNRKVEGLLQEMITAGEDQTPALDEVRPTVCVCLTLLLKDIRPSYTDLLRRIDLEGESMDVVANDLGVTPNNLTVRLHRARKALKARLEQVCGVCTKHGCFNCTCS